MSEHAGFVQSTLSALSHKDREPLGCVRSIA
jgi:hypothetical protein